MLKTYKPWTLKLSNIISAVFSLFSGALRGGSVYCYRFDNQRERWKMVAGWRDEKVT